ncbi:unnamed protein product [Meloidogyne enterolobii]|uniref:Uncharacterized protein n=1 Tax=Meloidogyne enterolobii TaxID=390850 RepID=A0ACB1AM97_MELEN
MKLFSFLIFLIFNAILWSLIISVKTSTKGKGLIGDVENDCTTSDQNEILNDGAESSVNPQIQKYKETLKPKSKITKKDKKGNNEDEKKLRSAKCKAERNKRYYEKNKEKLLEYRRNLYEKSKEKILQTARNYYQNNKEKVKNYRKNYRQNNKEKVRNYEKKCRQNNKEKRKEYRRKYYLKKKNEKEILQNESSELKNVQTENNEGCSFVDKVTDKFVNKGKMPIVNEESFQSEDENISNQDVEECTDKDKIGTSVDDTNKNVVEGTNEILGNQISEKNYRFDLNEVPEDEDDT